MSHAADLALASTEMDRELATISNYQLLWVERHPEEKEVRLAGSWDRRADVFVYDYDGDRLLTAVVNLTEERIDGLTESRGTQLPLSLAEVEMATTIAFDDPQLRPEMDREFRRIQGETLRGPEQLNIKTFVFHESAMPNVAPAGAAGCGIRRCVQLLIYTTDDVVFETLPIVDLSRRRVAGVIVAPGDQ